MQRYFVEEINKAEMTAIISGQDVHHIKNVMRLKTDDNIIINTFLGMVYLAKIISLERNQVSVKIIEEIKSDYKPLSLTLGMAMIKRDKFELTLQKATELGVKAILPVKTENSIIKIDDFSNKKTRYETIVKEASEQSERPVLPEIIDLTDLRNINFQAFDRVICAYAREEQENKLSNLIMNLKSNQSVLILIGPEGGFSKNEIEFLSTKNVEFVSLGNTILRAETAAIYLISAFRLMWEN